MNDLSGPELIKLREQSANVIDKIDKQLHEKRGTRKIPCGYCNYKNNTIKNLTFVQTMWYTQPHGCMGGDHWNQGDYGFYCLKCSGFNCLNFNHPYEKNLDPYNRQNVFKRLYRDCFKKIVREYDDFLAPRTGAADDISEQYRSARKFNNSYVDKVMKIW